MYANEREHLRNILAHFDAPLQCTRVPGIRPTSFVDAKLTTDGACATLTRLYLCHVDNEKEQRSAYTLNHYPSSDERSTDSATS